MWDALLSNPATRAYLMRFPPSTWEEKAVEAVQSAVEVDKVRQRSGSSSGTSQSKRVNSNRRSREATSRTSKQTTRRGSSTSRSIRSSPSLPAQPISVVASSTSPPGAAGRYPLVRPLTPNHPLLTGHRRPATYAEEYYYAQPYTTSSAAIGSHMQLNDWPHRIGRNERNYSSATLLHHHTHPTSDDRAETKEEAATATETADEAVQTALLPSSAHYSAMREDASVEGASDESERAVVGVDGDRVGSSRRYEPRNNGDITINVQYQHPPSSHRHVSPSLPGHSQHAAQQEKRAVEGTLPAHIPATARAPASPAVRIVSAPSPSPSTSTPFYSSAPPSRPPLHPSYSHPHSVYPSWWPSEEDLLAQERREEAKRREEELRQRRAAARQRAHNERVRAVMDHTCPPPPPQAREGVAERKEERQRQWKRADTERARDGVALQPDGGNDVNILAAQPSSAASVGRFSRRPLPSRSLLRPSHVVHSQSRIKPLLDRDRMQGALLDKCDSAPLIQPQQPPVSSVGGSNNLPPVVGPLSLSPTGDSYASLIRSLATDPIIASFASRADQQHHVPLSHSSNSASNPSLLPSTSTSPSAASRAASVLAAAASVSASAAAAALAGLDNINNDTAEDRAAARREWDNIAAAQAAQPFSRQLQQRQWQQQRAGWREVHVDDASDDSNEADRLPGEHITSASDKASLSF